MPTPVPPPLPILAALALLGLAACTQTGAPTAADGPSARAASLDLPASGACAEEIRAFRALLDRDNETGFVGPTVYRDATGDLAGPAATCRAGNDAAARAELRAVKTRFGYPA
ncbi:hypothetical protein ACTZWW_07610 [Salinarimonas sp. NSM]|uniref:hypothetical protein n=1 Tax=Salinarimonas sp. NSM TaxID=3458003 RepID=UPI0040354BCB